MDHQRWLSDGSLETSWALVKNTASQVSVADLLSQSIWESGFLVGSPASGMCPSWGLQVCVVSVAPFSYRTLRHLCLLGAKWLCADNLDLPA